MLVFQECGTIFFVEHVTNLTQMQTRTSYISFNLFEKYARQIGNLPQIEVKMKKMKPSQPFLAPTFLQVDLTCFTQLPPMKNESSRHLDEFHQFHLLKGPQ